MSEDVVDVANLDFIDTVGFVANPLIDGWPAGKLIDAFCITVPLKSMRRNKNDICYTTKTVKMGQRDLRHVVKWC